MQSWQHDLAVLGIMTAILSFFLLIRWLIYKRDMRELERERQQWRKEMDDGQRDARRRWVGRDEIRRENPADRPTAGE